MLESIRTLDDIPSTDAVLVTREERSAARSRRLLMQEARDRAKACVAQALQDAEAIRANAFQEGYSQGVLQAAGDLNKLLLQSRRLATALQADLLEAARELLGDWLMDEQLLNALLQRWQGRAGHGQGPLEVILPLRCKPQQAVLKSALKDLGSEAVNIHFHAQERYLFRLDDQVIELDIDASRERLSPRLVAQLKQLPDAVRQLDVASRQLFIDWVSRLNEEVGDLNQILGADSRDEH